MSGAQQEQHDPLQHLKRVLARYRTEPADSMAVTLPAASAVERKGVRGSHEHLRDVDYAIDALADECSRLRRALGSVRTALQGHTQAPTPLVPQALQAEVERLRQELTGKGGLVERLVAVEYLASRDPHAHEGWLTGLTVGGALVSAVSALVCVVAVAGVLLVSPERSQTEGPTAGAEASIGSDATADGAKVVRGEGALQEAYTPREGQHGEK